MQHVKAVIFDWAGTVVDHGSLAPMGAFVETFADSASTSRSTKPAARWAWPSVRISPRCLRCRGSRRPGETIRTRAERRRYRRRLRDLRAAQHIRRGRVCDLDRRRRRGRENAARAKALKIGSTTGYTRDIMAEITPVAAAQGFAPDSLVCTGDTPDGRPTPFMLYRCLLDLGSGRPGALSRWTIRRSALPKA